MKKIINAIAHYHRQITSQYNYKENFSLQYANYTDVVRLYAMTGTIPGENEILKTLNFNFQILKEKVV